MPDTLDLFEGQYIDFNTKKIKNIDALKRRIVGLSSYFSSAQENLLPKYDKIIVFTIGEKKENFEVENLMGNSVQVFQVGLKNINCYSLQNQLLNAPKIVKRILYILKEDQIYPDVLFGHAQLFNYYILLLVHCLKFKKAKLVWEFNVIWSFEGSGGLKVKLRSLLQRRSQSYILKNADGLVFQTKSGRDFIFDKYNYEHQSSVVIENSVEVSNSISVVDRLYPSVFLVYGLFDELNGIKFLLFSVQQLLVIGATLKTTIYGRV